MCCVKRLLLIALIVQFAWRPFEPRFIFGQESIPSPSREAATESAVRSILTDDWIGTWTGTVSSESAQERGYSYQLKLAIAATKQPDRLSWTLTIDNPQGETIQEYELVKKRDHPSHYALSSKNGTEIPMILIEDAMLSHHSVSGKTTWRKYELQNIASDEMLVESVEAPSQLTVASGGKEGVPEVVSLLPLTRQVARLKRIESPSETGGSLAHKTIWKKLPTVAHDDKQDDIYFVDDRVGWYANGAGKIYKTTDGGDSWRLQHDSPGTFFRCLAFIDHLHGFAGNVGPDRFPNVTDTNPLYETKDGGETWKAVTTIEGKPVLGLCSMHVLRDQRALGSETEQRPRIIGVGRVGGPTALIISDDLGATWKQIDLSAQAAMAFDVYFQDRDVGFIATATDTDFTKSHASILRTDDGGATWKKVYESSRPYELTWKLSFPTRDTGYVTIQSYNPDVTSAARFLAKTQDGGKTWREIPLIDKHSVQQFGVAFLDEQTGWVGAVPHGFFTNNGGRTWRKASIGNAVNKIRLLSTPSKTIGFAIGTEVHRLEIAKDGSSSD
jgi:photosystem II stability/assembly factor-like uncharacterized protein